MRVLRDCQGCIRAAQSYPATAQHRALARVQQLWIEWEIQCLVLVSFSLQAFLLFTAGFRKRHRSRVLSGLLWLAYLSADSVAVFVLGRLTLHTGDPRHQLVIFWAPFLLLHLGGQETIAAFSMEDCALWKRHLLNLATQSTLAVYVVGKQWRGDKRLVFPMLLMFVCGVGKYAERTWDLRRAGSRAPGSSSIAGHVTGARREFEREVFWYYDRLNDIVAKKLQLHFELVMELATRGFQLSLDFLMEVIPAKSLRPETDWNEGLVARIKSSENRADLVYKLAEVHLSLIYDYLYTKFGGFLGVLHRPTTFVLTSIALSLFLVVLIDQKGTPTSSYYGNDITISYILLVGAVALEISSIFMWFMSSYWPYMTISYLQHRGRHKAFRTMLLIIVRRLGRERRVEWSGKLPQYNMISVCNRENQAGPLEKMMRCVGIERDYTTHVVVSPEVKKVLLDQLLEIATSTSSAAEELDFANFRGQWARNGVGWPWFFENEADPPCSSEGAADQPSSSGSAAQDALQISAIQDLDFVSSAILWHFVTDICLLASQAVHEATGGISRLRRSSEELSNYIMYLVVKCNVMLGSDGHYVVKVARRDVMLFLGMVVDRKEFIQKVSDGDPDVNLKEFPALDRAHRVSSELLKMHAHNRWKLIALVWVEMLCYVAHNCGAGFHAKHLSTGGEFVTHVKMLFFILGFPLRGHSKEQLFPSEEIEERKFLKSSHPWRRG
ncbi:uncharacterized protein LOC133909718 [Phragmites australis]|uniref:uncharacterized protein LOC133909718 n=1 Tax=Phragmites australis TaxID=29695 RepID=UPI002D79168A|nr:uncharacterized protein LOC133909718 [Phragmites australis]